MGWNFGFSLIPFLRIAALQMSKMLNIIMEVLNRVEAEQQQAPAEDLGQRWASTKDQRANSGQGEADVNLGVNCWEGGLRGKFSDGLGRICRIFFVWRGNQVLEWLRHCVAWCEGVCWPRCD